MKLVLFMMGYGLDGAELLRYVAEATTIRSLWLLRKRKPKRKLETNI